LLLGVLDQADRYRQRVFDGFPGGFVPGHQTSRGTFVHLPDKHRPDSAIVGLRNLTPNIAIRVAETPERAEAFCVGELKDRAVQQLRLIEISVSTRRLGTGEASFEM
jgi:hypothetical protein